MLEVFSESACGLSISGGAIMHFFFPYRKRDIETGLLDSRVYIARRFSSF
jgi:hypothetical protein